MDAHVSEGKENLPPVQHQELAAIEATPDDYFTDPALGAVRQANFVTSLMAHGIQLDRHIEAVKKLAEDQPIFRRRLQLFLDQAPELKKLY